MDMRELADLDLVKRPARSRPASGRRSRRSSAGGRRATNQRRLLLEQLESRRVLSVSGSVLTDDIYPARDTDDHFFAVSEQDLADAGGQYVVTLALAGAVDGFQPLAKLYSYPGDPIGSELDSGSSNTYTLTTAGTYFVRVQDNDNQDTGTYALALEGIHPPSQDAQQTTLGDVESGRLDLMGEVDEYTFTATAGNVVTISLSEAHLGSRATLYSPTGDTVKLYSAQTGNRVTRVVAGNKVLSEPLQAGTYVIQVHDDNYMDVGDYQLALEGLLPASSDAVSLTLGEYKTGEIVAGEVDAYKFTAAGGEIVTVSLSDVQSGSSTELWAELYSPSGKKVEKLPGTNGPSEVENGKKVFYQLPAETGTYVIQVYDNDYTDAEAYGVALEGLNPPSLDAVAMTLGEQRTGTIDGMGEVDEFRFTLTAAELAANGGQYQVRLSLSSDDTADYKPRAAIYAPSGALVGRELGPGDATAPALSQAGTYVIQVYDNDYTHTKTELINRGKDPAYTVDLQDAQPPLVQSATASDPLLTDADAGAANLAVTVVFSETMDTATLPALVYSHAAVIGGTTPTLSNPTFHWATTAVVDDTVIVTYDVTDRELAAANITIDVTGAKDAAGNLMQNYTPEAEFSIDMQNPSVSAFTPRDNATRVALNANLVIAFDESVQKGSGTITIRRSSDGSMVEAISVSSSQVTLSAATVTIPPADPLLESTGYYVEVSTGAFQDLAGNDFSGVHGGATWNFTTGDFTPPAVTALRPADEAVDVAIDTNLEIVFNEPVRAGLGSVAIRRLDDGSTVETIAVPSDRVAVAGTTVTIDPTVTLSDNTSHYVEVTSGAFEDLSANVFAGISGAAAWNWTTVDLPPTVLSLSPPDDAAGVPQDANLIITFNEPVQKGAGDIVIKRSSDGSTFQTIPVDDGQVLVSGAVATIDPAAVLERREDYYVEIAAGAFQDLTGNPFAGISGETAWNFATVGPIASDDEVTTNEDTLINIEVLNNDFGIGRPLDPATLAIVAGSGPAFGTATVIDGLISYTPDANFSGTDILRYTVRDVVGYESDQGVVTIAITEVPDYQNPELHEDVNRSGAVTPLDVLIGINRINGHGNQLPPDPIPPEVPLYYYDVDGSNLLEPVDLLIIINYLNRTPGTGEGEGEAGAGFAADSLTPFPSGPDVRHAGMATVDSRGAKGTVDESSVLPRGTAGHGRLGVHAFALPSAGAGWLCRHDAALAAWGQDADGTLDFPLDDVLALLAADLADAGRNAE